MTRGPCRDHINQVSNHPPRPKYSGLVDGRTDPRSRSSGLLWRKSTQGCMCSTRKDPSVKWLARTTEKNAQVANGYGRLEKTSQNQRNRKGTVISTGWEPLLDQGNWWERAGGDWPGSAGARVMVLTAATGFSKMLIWRWQMKMMVLLALRTHPIPTFARPNLKYLKWKLKINVF